MALLRNPEPTLGSEGQFDSFPLSYSYRDRVELEESSSDH
jgi:hypothetical protein